MIATVLITLALIAFIGLIVYRYRKNKSLGGCHGCSACSLQQSCSPTDENDVA